jgi:hypothetical protein
MRRETKLSWYVLPGLIPVALVGGAVPARAFHEAGAARIYCTSLAILAVGILLADAPGRWQRIDQVFQTQRDRSRASYAMAMIARGLKATRGGGELFFAGTTLPTLVYYSGMPCHFVPPSRSEPEPADLRENPRIPYHQLAMRDHDGKRSLLPTSTNNGI